MKKYFLTTALMGTFIAPAFGADKIITSANTCTVDVLGVSDNNATANTIATWDLIDYTLDPGEYLNVTDTSVTETTCPAGSYCVGGGFTVETANNSIAQCPTTHPNSAEGAGADTQCYTACTVDMVAKATAVTGNDYYGSGVDTCGATACETGYHVDGGGLELVEKTPLVPISLTAKGAGYRYVRADDGTSGYSGTVDAIPADSVTAPNTWAMAYSEGVVYGKASCQPKADAGMEYIMTNLFSIMSGEMSIEAFESGMLPLAGKEKTDYAVKILTGVRDGSVSDEEVSNAFNVVFGSDYDADYQTTDTGQYCYCQMDGFTPTGGTKEVVTSAPWVFNADDESADDCASGCAHDCANYLYYVGVGNLTFRAALVGALEAVETGGICAANTINIDWNPDNNGAHTINQCTYEGSITVPADPVKPGYTFTGWKLVE